MYHTHVCSFTGLGGVSAIAGAKEPIIRLLVEARCYPEHINLLCRHLPRWLKLLGLPEASRAIHI